MSVPSSRRSSVSVDTSADESLSPKTIWHSLREHLWIGRSRRTSAWELVQRDCSDYFIASESGSERASGRSGKKKGQKEAKARHRSETLSEQRPSLSLSSPSSSLTTSYEEAAPAGRQRLSCDWGIGFGGVQQSVNETSFGRITRPPISGPVAGEKRRKSGGSTSTRGLSVNVSPLGTQAGHQCLSDQKIHEQPESYRSSISPMSTWLSNNEDESHTSEDANEEPSVGKPSDSLESSEISTTSPLALCSTQIVSTTPKLVLKDTRR